MFSMLSGLDPESQRLIVERWMAIVRDHQKKRLRENAIKVLSSSTTLGFRDLHLVSKMLQD